MPNHLIRNLRPLLGCLALFTTALLSSLSAQTYSTTLSGVTTWNGFGAPSTFATEYPVGTEWSAYLVWDTSAAALATFTRQATFRLTTFQLTLHGQSGTFTTSALPDKASFGVTNNSGNTYHSIQFTIEAGTVNLTTGSTYGADLYSINISLGGNYTNGAASLTTPPDSLDLANYDLTNASTSLLKIYYDNSGVNYLQGSISAPALAPVPEPSTYALLAGCGVFAVVMLRRRRN